MYLLIFFIFELKWIEMLPLTKGRILIFTSIEINVLHFGSLFEHFVFLYFKYISYGILTRLRSEARKQSMELVKLTVTFYKVRNLQNISFVSPRRHQRRNLILLYCGLQLDYWDYSGNYELGGYICIYTHIYIHTYICMCVCVCVCIVRFI